MAGHLVNFGLNFGLISQFIMINWLIKHRGNVMELIGLLISVIKREKMIEKVESKGMAGPLTSFWG